MEVLTLTIPEDVDVAHPTFAESCLTTVSRLDELGLNAVGQSLEPDRTVIQCRVVAPSRWCRKCGCEGAPRDTVIHRLAHEPFGHRPTTLLIRVRRNKCSGCARAWRQDPTSAAVAPTSATGGPQRQYHWPPKGNTRWSPRPRILT